MRPDRRKKGFAPPAFPNGWFAVLRSRELKKEEVKYVSTHGESLAVFRGSNNQVYILEAFCPHLGANFALGGKVVNQKCIECPFHAWKFDGETGERMSGAQKNSIVYEFEDKCSNGKKSELTFNQKGKSHDIKARKFPSREICGYIFAYFDNSEEYRRTGIIPYEPLDLTEVLKDLDVRGYSSNKIECHMSEIYENTADSAHLNYIHDSMYPGFIQNGWKNVDYVAASDPEFESKTKHDIPECDAYRKKILNMFINEKNRKYIGVYMVDATVKFGENGKVRHLLCSTGIQVGGGLSYIFVLGNKWNVFWTAFIDPQEDFLCYLNQEFYTCKWFPYFMSAYFIHSEQQQMLNDQIVWDNKRYPWKCNLVDNIKDESNLAKWFRFYNQFYDGCREYEEEKKRQNISW